ncbi:MAG TPA: hypothetical protein VFF40_14585 [Acidimicrobiia bacterium]|nr:hypothetical protein [Acidimicrobiia bacterium]
MRSRGTATVILTLGLLGAGLSAFLGGVSATALHEPALASTAGAMLDAGSVRDPMRARTADALVVAIPAVSALDPETRGRLTDSVLDQPVFVNGFADILSSVHGHVFDGEGDPILMDPAAVRTATDAALVEVVSDLAGAVPPDSLPVVTIDTAPIPQLDGWDRVIRVGAIVAGVASLAAIGLGIALAHPRLRAVARVGRWCIGISIGVLAVFWFGPTIVLPIVGGWSEVGGIALSGSGALVTPAVVALGSGIGVTYFANRLSKLQREHTLATVPKAPTRRATEADRRTA